MTTEKPRIRVVAGAPTPERHVIVIPPQPKGIPEGTIGRIAIDFFQHWFNAPGKDTQEGFNQWWDTNKTNYSI